MPSLRYSSGRVAGSVGAAPGRWETARDDVRFVVGDHLSGAELDALASAHLINASWRRETRWRPELVNGQEVIGLEHLQTALEQGRGCLLSFAHHGDYTGSFPSLARAGYPVQALATSDMFDPDAPLWLRTHTRAITSVPGAEALNVAGGSALVRDQFVQGGPWPSPSIPRGTRLRASWAGT